MANSSGDPYEDLAPLKPEEVHFLAAVAKRAFQSVLRHPDPIYLKSHEKTGKLVEPLKEIYVASLAFQLPDPHHHSKELSFSERSRPWSPLPYRLVEFQGDGGSPGWEDLPNTVKDFLDEGRKVGASPHFVLLNELSHGFEERERLKSKWVDLAETYSTYILPGTFHCTTEFFGVAPIYCPDRRRFHSALKQNAAIKQEERIRTPDARELLVFETDYGNIVLWICLDMYDPGLVLKFLNITHRFTGKRQDRAKKKREISLVLIPAYSKDSEDNIKNCVKTISRFSKTAMVCTNSFLDPGVENRLESHGFSCGEQMDIVLQKKYQIEGLKETFCMATLYRLDLKTLEEHQAANYQQNGIFSSAFSAIINGGPYVLHDVPD